MSWKNLLLWLITVVFLGLSPALLAGQDKSGSQPTSITGCLKQGTDAHGYYLVADGKMYEVMGRGMNLAEHVNHTVTVTGETVKLPEAQESKKEATEKSEAGSNPYADFRATDIKHVSDSCSQ
jgi:hypothetical protein